MEKKLKKFTNQVRKLHKRRSNDFKPIGKEAIYLVKVEFFNLANMKNENCKQMLRHVPRRPLNYGD